MLFLLFFLYVRINQASNPVCVTRAAVIHNCGQVCSFSVAPILPHLPTK